MTLTPPAGILLTITDEFLRIRALPSVYSENNINTEKESASLREPISIHNYTTFQRIPLRIEKQNLICNIALLWSQHTESTFQETFRFDHQTQAAQSFSCF